MGANTRGHSAFWELSNARLGTCQIEGNQEPKEKKEKYSAGRELVWGVLVKTRVPTHHQQECDSVWRTVFCKEAGRLSPHLPGPHTPSQGDLSGKG